MKGGCVCVCICVYCAYVSKCWYMCVEVYECVDGSTVVNCMYVWMDIDE